MTKKKWKTPLLKKVKYIDCWKSKYNWRVWVEKDNFHLGHAVDIGTRTDFFCHKDIWIGDQVQIGGHCLFYTDNSINKTRSRIIIGDKACIGAKSIIFPGVTIRKNEMIPAGSIVYFRKGKRIIK